MVEKQDVGTAVKEIADRIAKAWTAELEEKRRHCEMMFGAAFVEVVDGLPVAVMTPAEFRARYPETRVGDEPPGKR